MKKKEAEEAAGANLQRKVSKALAKAREENKLTSILGKAWLPALAILAAFAMFAVGGQVRSAEADIDFVTVVDLSNDELYDSDGDGCDEAGIFDV
jgi:hypothetical protein